MRLVQCTFRQVKCTTHPLHYLLPPRKVSTSQMTLRPTYPFSAPKCKKNKIWSRFMYCYPVSWMFSMWCNYWLLFNFEILYFSTDGCINKSLTYLLTYLLTRTNVSAMKLRKLLCIHVKLKKTHMQWILFNQPISMRYSVLGWSPKVNLGIAVTKQQNNKTLQNQVSEVLRNDKLWVNR